MFLVIVTQYDSASAYTLPDVFERGINDEIENTTDELTDDPTPCPHNEPIPSKDGVMPITVDIPRVEVLSASDCVVSRVRAHDTDKLGYSA